MSRLSFQTGTLVKVPTVKGFRWVLRYYRDGVQKAKTVGTHLTLPTEALARMKANELVPAINDTNPIYTFGQLVAKYELDEMPSREDTAASYRSMLKHLSAGWSDVPVTDMLKNLMAIQSWLSDLKGKTGKPLSKKTKQHIKALLHRIIECAMRWGYLPVDRNPISLVEVRVSGIQPKKRLKVPLTLGQLKFVFADKEIAHHVRVMISIAVFTGMRVSEILGLRWEDIDLAAGTVSIQRSFVGKFVGETKTQSSEAVLPLPDQLVTILATWQTEQPSINGWVFGSVTTGRPFHRDSLQADHLLPAGLRHGIQGLGWHTFRHSHIAYLREMKTAPEVQMMLMRHSDMRTTNSYGRDGGSLELKRPANQAVVDFIVGREG